MQMGPLNVQIGKAPATVKVRALYRSLCGANLGLSVLLSRRFREDSCNRRGDIWPQHVAGLHHLDVWAHSRWQQILGFFVSPHAKLDGVRDGQGGTQGGCRCSNRERGAGIRVNVHPQTATPVCVVYTSRRVFCIVY